MSFSSALNLGGLRSGICTSTSKPASPHDGQIIYMTDVDQSAVWDGSAWVGLDPSRDRNVVINGAMQVAQRGTSTASITGSGYYTADRFEVGIAGIGTWTQSVENDAPTGSGFRKSLKMLCTTADASPAAGEVCLLYNKIEGQNLQQFLKGTASAKQWSLSFWVKSNVTGTYIVELYDYDNSRQVSASYTVSASATWEKKTITFPADTTGALDNDNNNSLSVNWWFAAGSNYTSGTLNTTWASVTNANRAVGQTNLAAATNNYWQITGVQLEAGAVATPFEFEDYGITLKKCQRYFQRFSGASTEYFFAPSGFYFDANQVTCLLRFSTMRAAPTTSFTGTANTDYAVYFNAGIQAGFTFAGQNATTDSVAIACNKTGHGGTNTPSNVLGLTASGRVNLSAEL